jgi:hypothetical protein
VVALIPNEIVEEQVQVGEDIRETSTIDANKIKVDLEKIILMIEEQKNVILTPLSKQKMQKRLLKLMPILMEVTY